MKKEKINIEMRNGRLLIKPFNVNLSSSPNCNINRGVIVSCGDTSGHGMKLKVNQEVIFFVDSDCIPIKLDNERYVIMHVSDIIGGFKNPVTKKPKLSKKKNNPAAVELGRLGGLKGGKARAAKLSKEKRSAIAKKAVQTRWEKAKSNKSTP